MLAFAAESWLRLTFSRDRPSATSARGSNTNAAPIIASNPLTFLVEFLLYRRGRFDIKMLTRMALFFALVSIPFRLFVYPSFALLVTALALQASTVPRLVELVSRYTYEFYLCHGIFFVGSRELLGVNVALSVFIGIAASGLVQSR